MKSMSNLMDTEKFLNCPEKHEQPRRKEFSLPSIGFICQLRSKSPLDRPPPVPSHPSIPYD